jgi:hypothetical protein
MTIILPILATLTQTVVIKTDVEPAYSIVCLFTAMNLMPTTAYISLSAKIISVNASLISMSANFGTHLFAKAGNS